MSLSEELAEWEEMLRAGKNSHSVVKEEVIVLRDQRGQRIATVYPSERYVEFRDTRAQRQWGLDPNLIAIEDFMEEKGYGSNLD